MSKVRGDVGMAQSRGVDGTVRSNDEARDDKLELQTPHLDDLSGPFGWFEFRFVRPFAVEAAVSLNLAPDSGNRALN